MATPIQRDAEMQRLNRQMPFTSGLKEDTDEESSIPIQDPDTILPAIVLLLACLALAVLADVVI